MVGINSFGFRLRANQQSSKEVFLENKYVEVVAGGEEWGRVKGQVGERQSPESILDYSQSVKSLYQSLHETSL